jgi:hypothetical protein
MSLKKCFRCRAESFQTWDICSDDNVGREVCIECDIKLNELVLMFMGFKDWQEKIEKYKETLREE